MKTIFNDINSFMDFNHGHSQVLVFDCHGILVKLSLTELACKSLVLKSLFTMLRDFCFNVGSFATYLHSLESD